MAFSIKKYNKGGKFSVNTANLPYKKLKELYAENGVDAVYPIGAIYINTKSKFGENPTACVMAIDAETGEINPVFMVNLPRHMTDDVRAMLEDNEAVEAIKNVRVGFSVREYYTKVYNTNAYSVEWEDLE